MLCGYSRCRYHTHGHHLHAIPSRSPFSSSSFSATLGAASSPCIIKRIGMSICKEQKGAIGQKHTIAKTTASAARLALLASKGLVHPSKPIQKHAVAHQLSLMACPWPICPAACRSPTSWRLGLVNSVAGASASPALAMRAVSQACRLSVAASSIDVHDNGNYAGFFLSQCSGAVVTRPEDSRREMT